MLILCLTGLLFLFLGYLIKYQKCYWLISGYNTMSREKKRRVDVAGLGKFLGNSLFLMAGLMFVAALFTFFENHIVVTVAIFAIAPVTIFILIKAQKFDGNNRNADGSMNWLTKIIIGSLIVIFMGTGVAIWFSFQTPEVLVGVETVQIKGLYSMRIDRNDIQDLELVETFPPVTRKTNGFNFGKILKGNFLLQGGMKAKLYVDVSKPPFIKFNTPGEVIILNLGGPEETRALFKQLVYD